MASVKEVVAPLQDELSELEQMDEALAEQRAANRAERQRIERVLRAAGLIEPPKPNGNGAKKAGPSEESLTRVSEWIAKQEDSFTVAQGAKGSGVHTSTFSLVVKVLRTRGKVRLLGRAPNEPGQTGKTPLLYARS